MNCVCVLCLCFVFCVLCLCCGLSSVGWSKSVFDHLKLEAAQTP